MPQSSPTHFPSPSIVTQPSSPPPSTPSPITTTLTMLLGTNLSKALRISKFKLIFKPNMPQDLIVNRPITSSFSPSVPMIHKMYLSKNFSPHISLSKKINTSPFFSKNPTKSMKSPPQQTPNPPISSKFYPLPPLSKSNSQNTLLTISITTNATSAKAANSISTSPATVSTAKSTTEPLLSNLPTTCSCSKSRKASSKAKLTSTKSSSSTNVSNPKKSQNSLSTRPISSSTL